MALINRENAKQVGGIRWIDVPVPEWGDGVVARVRGLPVGQRSAVASMEPGELTAWLIAHAVIDEDGNLVYAWPEDREFLIGRDGAGGERIAKVALGLFSISEEKVAEAEKN